MCIHDSNIYGLPDKNPSKEALVSILFNTNISIIHCQRYQISYGRFRRKHDLNVFHIFIQLGSMRPSAAGPMHDVHRVGAIRLLIRSSLLNACRLNPIMNIDTSSLPLADILGEKDEKSNKCMKYCCGTSQIIRRMLLGA